LIDDDEDVVVVVVVVDGSCAVAGVDEIMSGMCVREGRKRRRERERQGKTREKGGGNELDDAAWVVMEERKGKRNDGQ
jgi:hypothetical protein